MMSAQDVAAWTWSHASVVTLGVISLACLLGSLQLYRTWRRLRHIPGPFPACITNFHRAYWVTTKRAHLILQDVHEKYGEIVRIGPNTVVFSNPEAIPTVYPARTGFPKSEFYLTLQAYNPNSGSLQAIFNTPDEDMHKRLKSPIASLFTPNNVPAYEGRVDEVLALLGARLDEQFLQHDRIFELGSWLQFFAFDVMGTLTFSKRYGFLETGKDVGRMLSTIKDFMRSSAPLTQIAWLDWLLRKNRVGDWLQRHFFTQASMGILGFVGKAIGEKRAALAAAEKANATAETTAAAHGGKLGRDFLTHYVELQQNDPQIPPWAPTAWTFSNVIAGSDSVGSLMRTTVFNLLAYPHTLERLYQELRDSVDTSSGSPFPAYATVRNLPYLDACVQEGIRMHPPFCLPFERVVPRGGVTVLGKFLPEGTVVGGSPYVVNRHRGTFGDDAEFWRPERWLEKGDEHKRKLEQSMLTFGSGRRVCLGRHVGIMEIKKLISFLVLNYDIRIVDPEKFEVENSWFFFQKGLYARIRKRSDTTAAST